MRKNEDNALFIGVHSGLTEENFNNFSNALRDIFKNNKKITESL